MGSRHLSDTVLVQKCFLVRKDGKILTLQGTADDPKCPLAWEFPGGGYELGEDTAQAIKREVKEETNLTLNSCYPVYCTNITNKDSWLYQAETTLVICYASRDWEGEFKLSAEHRDFRWETPQQLLSRNFEGDGGLFHSALRAYLTMESH